MQLSTVLDGVSGFSSVFLKGNTFYFIRSKLLYCKHLPMLWVQEFTQYKYCTLKVQFVLYISMHTRTVCTEHGVDERTK